MESYLCAKDYNFNSLCGSLPKRSFKTWIRTSSRSGNYLFHNLMIIIIDVNQAGRSGLINTLETTRRMLSHCVKNTDVKRRNQIMDANIYPQKTGRRLQNITIMLTQSSVVINKARYTICCRGITQVRCD